MNRLLLTLGRFSGFGTVVAVAALALLVTGGLAQESAGQATPVGGAPAGDGPHPAHIHAGTCDELGDVVLPLEDVAEPDGERSGPASALPVKTSQTVVDLPLEEIVEGGHALNVHLSAEEIDEYIACGDIGGAVATDEGGWNELIVGLGEINGSGHVGTAWLGADGDQTEVVVILLEPEELG